MGENDPNVLPDMWLCAVLSDMDPVRYRPMSGNMPCPRTVGAAMSGYTVPVPFGGLFLVCLKPFSFTPFQDIFGTCAPHFGSLFAPSNGPIRGRLIMVLQARTLSLRPRIETCNPDSHGLGS